MTSLELSLSDIHQDWKSLWSQTLPDKLRAKVFDDRMQYGLGRRIVADLGARTLPGEAKPSDYREFLAFRAEPEHAAVIVGLLLFADPISRVVERTEVEKLFANYERSDLAHAVSLNVDRAAAPFVGALPDRDTVVREGRVSLRAWIETLPEALADRATVALPRDSDRAVFNFSHPVRVGAVNLVLESMAGEGL